MKKYLYKVAKNNNILKHFIKERERREFERNIKSSPSEIHTQLGKFQVYHEGTEDHISIIRSTIVSEDYNMGFCIHGRNLINEIKSSETINNLVVDLGSHIGVSMLYFATQFPQCTILGVEPNEFSANLINKNLSCIDKSRWEIYRACIGSEEKKGIPIYNNNNGSWSVSLINYTNQEAPLAVVDKISLKFLLAPYVGYKRFILKIDIEGAERELFEDIDSWEILNSFEVVIIELHDWMLPGEKTALPVLKWAVKFRREFILSGVNLFLFKEKDINKELNNN